MKDLVLYQHWASLMATGAKTIETRAWFTSYRGDLAICAGRTWDIVCSNCLGDLPIQQALREMNTGGGRVGVEKRHLPFGKVLCVVQLDDVLPTETAKQRWRALYEEQQYFGDFTDGRFAWFTENLRPLREPVPVTGRQGLFELPRDVELKVREQL